MKLSKTRFIGIEFTYKNGDKEVITPRKEVKKCVEDILNKNNNNI